jgi:hypothetical protein
MHFARWLLLAIVAASPALAAAQQRYWYDAGVRRALWAETAVVAEFGPKPSGKSTVLVPSGLEKSVSAQRSPVFRDGPSSGAPLRALAGGVIVRVKDGTGAAEREALFARLGIVQARPIGAAQRVWFVPSPPGIDALELANRLHESGELASASPNWWKARALK